MPRHDAILGIDEGTTGTRAVLAGMDGTVLSASYRDIPLHTPRPGWVEQDAAVVWNRTADAIRQVLDEHPDVRVVAIGITNQRETSVLWNRATGEPVHPAIVWQCRRTADRCRQLRDEGMASEIAETTGLVIDPYFSGTKVEWMLHGLGVQRDDAAGLAFGTMDTWLIWNLTGAAAHVTDMTNASRTMLFDIERREWSAELLDLLGVPRSILPEALPSAARFGETRGLGFLSDGIPVCGVAGDQQAALFGQTCLEPGSAKNTYGTGCFLLMHTGNQRPRSAHGLLTTLACDERGGPAYALEGSVFIGGAAIQWLRDGLGILATARESEALARSVPDAGGVVFVPALTGLGAPYWNPDVRGAVFGLTRGTTRAHLVRAALEAIAHQSADVVEAMAGDAGTPLDVLRVDGGAAANDFLMQMQADLLGTPVERPSVIETTVMGAILLAGIGSGVWSPSDARARWRVERRFEPEMEASERALRRNEWRDAVARLTAGSA